MPFEIDLFNKLSDRDILAIEDYIYMYGSRNDEEGDRSLKNNAPAALSYRLRYWNANKARLYQLLNNQFIYSKEIVFQENSNDKMDELDALLYRSTFITALKKKIMESMLREDLLIEKHYEDIWTSDCYCLKKLLWSYEDIYYNRLSQSTFYIKVKDNKPIKFQQGCKPIKVLAKIANQLGLDTEFEEFRLEHSRILNTANVKGTLCLSIHPLDYMTMSDNCCDWDSCMSWINGGCYHGGTVEMMNSPCVIIAYVKASDDMYLTNGFYWSNKKWRTLVIVDDKFVTTIKGYPYSHTGLDDIVLETIRELAAKNWNLTYDPGLINYKEDEKIPFKTGPKKVFFEANTMYNDFGRGQENHMLINSELATELPNKTIYYNYCGPRNCMWCGENYGFYSTGDVFCECCIYDDAIIGSCSNCGDNIYDGDCYYTLRTGELVCENCCDSVRECSICGDFDYSENLTPIFISYKGYSVTPKDIKTIQNNHSNNYIINNIDFCCCPNCFSYLNFYEKNKFSLLSTNSSDNYVLFDIESLDEENRKDSFSMTKTKNTFNYLNITHPSAIVSGILQTQELINSLSNTYYSKWDQLMDTIENDDTLQKFLQHRH